MSATASAPGPRANRELPPLVLARDWLGSVASRIGVSIVLFSLFCGIVVGADDIFGEAWAFAGGDVVEVVGTVTAVRETLHAPSRRRPGEPRRRPLEERTLRIDFVFVEESGRIWSDVSYSPDQRWSVGDDVPVEYPTGQPEDARVVGARSTVQPRIMAVMMAYGPIGFLLPFFSWLFYARRRRMLREGVVSSGRVVSMARMPSLRPTGRYGIEVEYEAHGAFPGTKTITGTNVRGVDSSTEYLDVIYHPEVGGAASIIAALPDGLRLDERGEWVITGGAGRAWLGLLWPVCLCVLLAVWFVFG